VNLMSRWFDDFADRLIPRVHLNRGNPEMDNPHTHVCSSPNV
jgi:hypothetical protein